MHNTVTKVATGLATLAASATAQEYALYRRGYHYPENREFSAPSFLAGRGLEVFSDGDLSVREPEDYSELDLYARELDLDELDFESLYARAAKNVANPSGSKGGSSTPKGGSSSGTTKGSGSSGAKGGKSSGKGGSSGAKGGSAASKKGGGSGGKGGSSANKKGGSSSRRGGGSGGNGRSFGGNGGNSGSQDTAGNILNDIRTGVDIAGDIISDVAPIAGLFLRGFEEDDFLLEQKREAEADPGVWGEEELVFYEHAY